MRGLGSSTVARGLNLIFEGNGARTGTPVSSRWHGLDPGAQGVRAESLDSKNP